MAKYTSKSKNPADVNGDWVVNILDLGAGRQQSRYNLPQTPMAMVNCQHPRFGLCRPAVYRVNIASLSYLFGI